MSEINNNIHNYGYGKIERVETKKDNETKGQVQNAEESAEYKYVPDTGVLGRSQVHAPGEINIEKSVNEAVELAKSNPVIMKCSEDIFDTMFEKYIKEGLTESEAYIRAAMDEQEFMEIASAFKK